MIDRAASLGSRDATALVGRKAAIFDRDNDGMSGVEGGTYLAHVGDAQSRAGRAAGEEFAFHEASEP